MIRPETIAQIKERTDIVALIGESVRLIRSGRSFKGLCPFHKEKSGSFYVHPDRGFYHCFGCGESGSAIDFAMKQNGLDFREAAIMLAERAGIAIEETNERREKNTSMKDDVFAVLALAASFFEKELALDASPAARVEGPKRLALREIHKRGMPERSAERSEEYDGWMAALRAFRVGYAPPEWDALANFLKKQGVAAETAERAGLLVPRTNGSGFYDRFRHRLMFAVMDTLGRVIAFSGRALEAPTPGELPQGAPRFDGEPPAKYINSPESPVYTKGQQLFGLFQAKRAMRERGEAILVEGNFDVVSLHARGVEHAVAPLGTAFTTEQATLLKRFAPRVIVCFDGDGAGVKATRAARGPCREGGLEARVASMPKGLDPDELVRTQGIAALLAITKSARGMLEHLVADALDSDAFQGATLTERVNRVKAVARLLGEENDPNMRLMGKRYADALSEKLVLGGRAPSDLNQLERLVQSAVGGENTRAQAPPSIETTPTEHLSRLALGALFDVPELLYDDEIVEALQAVEGSSALAVVALRQHLGAGHKQLDPEVLLASLPRSIHSFAAQRLASPTFETAPEAKADFFENIHKLRGMSWRREDAAAVDALNRASAALTPETEALLREVELRARKKRGLED